jgi:hypothetical protein
LDTGTSQLVVHDSEFDLLLPKKFDFAKCTLSQLACFMHHWWISSPQYDDSRIKPLKRSLCIEKVQRTDQLSWDPITLAIISHFSVKAET